MANGEYFHVSVGNDSKNLEAVADRVSRMETWRDTVYYPRVEQDPSKAFSRDELNMLLEAEGLKIRLIKKPTGVSSKLSLEQRSIQVQHVIEFLRSKPEFAKYVNPPTALYCHVLPPLRPPVTLMPTTKSKLLPEPERSSKLALLMMPILFTMNHPKVMMLTHTKAKLLLQVNIRMLRTKTSKWSLRPRIFH